jgi:hypothetical protein
MRKGSKASPETKAKQAEAARKRWKDKEYREKNEKRLREQAANPENKKKRIEATKKKFAEDPEFKKRFHEGTSKCSTETNLKNWKDPAYREKQTKNLRKALVARIQDKEGWSKSCKKAAITRSLSKSRKDEDKKTEETLSRKKIEHVYDEEHMLRLTQGRKDFYSSLTADEKERYNHERVSNRNKTCWKDPEYREKMQKVFRNNVKNGKLNKKNKLEEFFDSITGDNVEFCGQGDLWIEVPKEGRSKNPDFRVVGTNKIIELWGDLYHRGQNPREERLLYRKLGYDALVLWEHQVKFDTYNILQLVERFLDD